MVAVYGLVLTGIFAVASVVGTTLLFIRRNHPFIKCRNPPFLILQNVLTLLAASITSLYVGLRPNFSCYVYYIGSLLAFAGLGWPMAIRCWEYCVNFHISKVRSKFSTQNLDGSSDSSSSPLTRSNVLMPNWGQNSWFFRNRWVASPRFMVKVFVVGFWIWLLPVIPYFFLKDQYDYNDKTGGCSVYNGGVYLILLIVIVFVIFAIFLGNLMRGARDAYRIKNEIVIITLTWLVVFIIWTPYTAISFPFQKTLSPSFWILIGFYISFIFFTVFPLFLSYKHDQMDVGEATAGFKEFIEKLENLHFRNAFHDFLALQFCQENILFYEVVMDWRRMSHSDASRVSSARSIHENYILESGLCQINISGPVREKVSIAISKADSELPEDIFDEALAQVLNMMHSNSYYQFKSHRLYQNVKV